MARSQPRKIVHETLSQKNPLQKNRGLIAQGVGPEFKSQYHKKRESMREKERERENSTTRWKSLDPRVTVWRRTIQESSLTKNTHLGWGLSEKYTFIVFCPRYIGTACLDV
jgi:macrodomain Ter protein organizer (MatP/YcbG family)